MALALSNKEQEVCNSVTITTQSTWNRISQKPLTAIGNLVGMIGIFAGPWLLIFFFAQS